MNLLVVGRAEMESDKIRHSLVASAGAIASGEISSRELTEICIARIERLQPVLNCFISLDADNALAAAEAADKVRARGDSVGLLHGVPFAEDMLFRVAAAYEDATNWHQKHQRYDLYV